MTTSRKVIGNVRVGSVPFLYRMVREGFTERVTLNLMREGLWWIFGQVCFRQEVQKPCVGYRLSIFRNLRN